MLILVCTDPSSEGRNLGSCSNRFRKWTEVDVPNTDLTQEFLLELVMGFSPTAFTLIISATLLGLATGFGGGMLIGAIRKAKNLF